MMQLRIAITLQVRRCRQQQTTLENTKTIGTSGKMPLAKKNCQKCSGLKLDSKTVVPDLDFSFDILSDFFGHLL